jgi:IMP dehydrogenase
MNNIEGYFTRDELIGNEGGVNYDELLLRPQLSSIDSRSMIDTKTSLWNGLELRLPIISSPMSTISGHKMCIEMHKVGGLGVLHRFQSQDNIRVSLEEMSKEIPKQYMALAIGIKNEDYGIVNEFYDKIGIVCIDVNIGHHVKTINMIKWLKENFKDIKVIAGNVSTYQGALDLIRAGADCIRATNGAGSVCTTLTTTGVGVPSATSLVECVIAAKEYNKTVIADGGIKDSGTITKALALGANAVMLGGALAGTSSCPDDVFFTDEEGTRRARYFGMASVNAQLQRHDKTYGTPEGRSIDVPLKGDTKTVIDELVGGLKSGMSFCNAADLKQLRTNAKFIYRKI